MPYRSPSIPLEPQELLTRNREWAASMTRHDPAFFARLVAQQSPAYLWIGCSDSRVPANEIVGMAPGELFVHRNVANLVIEDDLNCLAVLQYAIDALHIEHVIVSGHYGCGGIRAVLEKSRLGLVDEWLKPVYQVAEAHAAELAQIASFDERWDRLCELNVEAQVQTVVATDIVQKAWARGQRVSVHGWIYGIQDGLVRVLTDVCVKSDAAAG